MLPEGIEGMGVTVGMDPAMDPVVDARRWGSSPVDPRRWGILPVEPVGCPVPPPGCPVPVPGPGVGFEVPFLHLQYFFLAKHFCTGLTRGTVGLVGRGVVV